MRPARFTLIGMNAVWFLTLLVATPAALALDWPQFRGPRRDGVWDETGIVESFPTNGLSFRWRQPVGGGWASPVVAQGRVIVSDVQLMEPKANERIHCFDEKTGKVLWTYSYPEKYSEWTFVPERGAGPTATPVIEKGRVYVVGANGFVHCLDLKNGRVIWENRLGYQYEVDEMQCRPSPLVEGSLLIVFAGARPGASLIALDKQTGKEVWKALDDRVSNSSPIVIDFAGKRQLVVWSNNAITSLDPASGHVFWRELLTTSGNDSIPTPVIQGNLLLISGLMLELTSNAPGAHFRWPENRVGPKRLLSNTSTPIIRGDYIFSARSSGELVCLETATGNQVWSTNSVTAPKSGASIHITPQGGGFFLFTDEGNLIRAELSAAGYREISRAHLIDPTWPFAGAKYVYAPLAFADRHVFARNEQEIVCVSLAKRR